MNRLEQITGFHQLPPDRQTWLQGLAAAHGLSFQQLRFLVAYSQDMICWDQGGLDRFYRPGDLGKAVGRQAAAKVFEQLKSGYEILKNTRKRYPEPHRPAPVEKPFPGEQIMEQDLKGTILGTCPVSSEKTRCCKLNTLDAVLQCGFECSYCSIQSFYHGYQVRFVRDLARHLERLTLDKAVPVHIGTGQSSDSLMWGNRFGLLDNLTRFAADHPNVILEMKSKSSRIDYFLSHPPPFNMVFTWSLNTPAVIAAEERGTAPLDHRIRSARQLADQGIPVGFHFHPMVWYDGWEAEYQAIVTRLTDTFSPDEVVMVSMGTLTFIKPVIRRIRERMAQTTILQMPMADCAGKLSYPFEIKKDLFSFLFQAFPDTWKSSVFFYMCMEDVDLWEPVLGRSYPSNEAFEQDMLGSYQHKIFALAEITRIRRHGFTRERE
jgi:spore photoproduct lyase